MNGKEMREPKIYSSYDRPDILVLVDGEWCRGERRRA